MTGRFFCLCVRIFIPNLMIWLSTVSRGEHLCLLTGVAGWIFLLSWSFIIRDRGSLRYRRWGVRENGKSF